MNDKEFTIDSSHVGTTAFNDSYVRSLENKVAELEEQIRKEYLQPEIDHVEDKEYEDGSAYCKECGSCGEDGCCSALMCAYKNMVERGCGDYCKSYYWDLVIAHESLKKLTKKQLDEINYNEILDKIYAEKERHYRKIEPWMEFTRSEIINLDDDNWEHYKKGGCLCSAHGDCECICGSWRKKDIK